MQFRAKHTAEEYSREIRQQDRGQIFAERRRRQQEPTKEFDFKQMPALIGTYMDFSLCEEVRFDMLTAAIHFTNDDDRSHYTVKLLLEKEGLINCLRETVYNENTKLEYRLQSLQLLAQMLYSNYELTRQLLDQQILVLMITQARQAYQHSQVQFLSIALLGLANAMGFQQKIREFYMEQEIDQLLLQILEKYQDEDVKKNIARIMNEWFRSKNPNLKIDLNRSILNHLICEMQDKEYLEDVIWFFYGFTSQALEQLKEQTEAIDPFIQSLIMNPRLTDFLKTKLQDTMYLGCVACVRAFSKMFKMISDQAPLQKIFYDDLRLLYRRAKAYEVNLTKLEVLKLMQIMHQHQDCRILSEEFESTMSYFSYSIKCQEQTLLTIKDCNFEIFDFTQLDTILQLCKNILMSDLQEPVKLQAVLAILLKLLPIPNLCLQVQDVLSQIESLIRSENKELSEIAHTFIENYKLFYMQ